MADRIKQPGLSKHFETLKSSSIREAANLLDSREDHHEITVINMAIGSVTLPMHPAMINRLHTLGDSNGPFAQGVVPYTRTRGTDEARNAFIHLMKSSGLETENLHCQVTEGASQAMQLILAGICGLPGTEEKPLLVLDATYTNYMAFAKSSGRRIVHVTRHLSKEGRFTLPDMTELEVIIEKEKPGGILVIPFDNPTGQHMRREDLLKIARLCVIHNLWLISDEAYRELVYTDGLLSSIWTISETDIPGIFGRRIGIESASKIWNACGLRIGAIVTDNKSYFEKSVFENMANLCANTIGQYIFSALVHESFNDLQRWFGKQRAYYKKIITRFVRDIQNEIPGIIASRPDAAMYTVLDVRDLVDESFQVSDFVRYCAEKGNVNLDGKGYTVLVSPMDGFYNSGSGGRTQMRIAFVDPPELLEKTPKIIRELLREFLIQ